jgi:hypothetical protein
VGEGFNNKHIMNKELLRQAFEAGRTWQIDETAEYQGGKENEKPNFEEF